MLGLLSLGLAFNAGAVSSRRELLAGLGLGAALSSPAPALAQRSALIPRSSKESTESFRQYRVSKPSDETEAFKQAEKRRLTANVGSIPKEETAEQTMRRLGMMSYSDSLASGKPDPCAEGSFACGRKK